MTTSITSPGVLPPTSQEPQRPTSLDSLVGVWAEAVRQRDDLAIVVEDMWRWAA